MAFNSVGNETYFGISIVEKVDGAEVEAWVFSAIVTSQIANCCTLYGAAFGGGHGLLGRGQTICPSGFDLDEMEFVATAGHNVQFVTSRTPVTGTDCISVAA